MSMYGIPLAPHELDTLPEAERVVATIEQAEADMEMACEELHAAAIKEAMDERDGELLAQILSAQESALRSQERETALTRRIDDLEDRIREMETWSGQKERYQLTKLPPGVLVYEIKEEARGDEPPHYVCGKCFEQQKRSFLNSDEPKLGRTKLHCPSCGWEDKIGHYKAPQVDRGPRGSSWMGT